MNVVVLSGNLVRDPEVRYSQDQLAIAKFTVAVSRMPKRGEDAGADFIRVTVFGKQAENVERYISKGSKVGVEGRIQTGSYEDKDGKTVYTTDVIANRVEFLDRKGQGQGEPMQNQGFQPSGGNAAPSGPAANSAPSTEVPEGFSSLDDDDDDVPF